MRRRSIARSDARCCSSIRRSTWIDKDKAKTGVDTDRRDARARTRRCSSRACGSRIRCATTRLEDFVPCGAVAGVFARTDAQRGVWKAPAGLEATLVGVPQLSVPLTDAENGELNPLGINCLRSLPAAGPRRLGRAHAAKATIVWRREWKYIPVRRTGALHRRESLPRHAMGRLRTQRRAAVGADPAERRRVHAQPVPPGRLPGHDAARSLLRQVRQGDHHAERHQSRHRQHRRRLRAAQARRVRRSSRSSRWPVRIAELV